MEEINLMYEQKEIQKKKTASSVIMITIIIIAVGLIVAIYFTSLGLKMHYVKKAQSADSEIAQVDQKVNSMKEDTDKAETLQKQLNVLQDVLDNHVRWSRVFDEINRLTIKNVYFVDFAGDTGGKINIIGMAPSYSDVAEQMKSFKKSKLFTDVDVSDVGLAEAKYQTAKQGKANYQFSMVITLSGEALVGDRK